MREQRERGDGKAGTPTNAKQCYVIHSLIWMPTQFNFKGEAVDTSMRVTRSDQLIFQFFLIVPQTSFFNAPLPFSLSALHFLSNLSSWNYQTNHIAGLSPAMPQLFWSVWRDAAGATRTPERICGCKGAEKRCRQSSNN